MKLYVPRRHRIFPWVIVSLAVYGNMDSKRKVRWVNDQAVLESKARVWRRNYFIAISGVGMSRGAVWRMRTRFPAQIVMEVVCDRMIFSRRERQKDRCTEAGEVEVEGEWDVDVRWILCHEMQWSTEKVVVAVLKKRTYLSGLCDNAIDAKRVVVVAAAMVDG